MLSSDKLVFETVLVFHLHALPFSYFGYFDFQIQAHYQTEWGEHKKSLLLTAGWYSSI